MKGSNIALRARERPEHAERRPQHRQQGDGESPALTPSGATQRDGEIMAQSVTPIRRRVKYILVRHSDTSRRQLTHEQHHKMAPASAGRLQRRQGFAPGRTRASRDIGARADLMVRVLLPGPPGQAVSSASEPSSARPDPMRPMQATSCRVVEIAEAGDGKRCLRGRELADQTTSAHRPPRCGRGTQGQTAGTIP